MYFYLVSKYSYESTIFLVCVISRYLDVNVFLIYLLLSQLDAKQRTCGVSAKIGPHRVKVNITFPPAYPNNVPPNFRFSKNTNIEHDLRTRVMKVCFVFLLCVELFSTYCIIHEPVEIVMNELLLEIAFFLPNGLQSIIDYVCLLPVFV